MSDDIDAPVETTESAAHAENTRRSRRFPFFSRRGQGDQLRYLSGSARLEEAQTPRLIKATAVTISASIICFVVWAAVTNINEVARTTGEVVPRGFEQIVQHRDGGIVEEIDAHEGALVEAGDVLVVLDGGGAREDLRRAERKQSALSIEAERLRAFLEDRRPDFSAFPSAGPAHIAEQQAIFDTSAGACRTGQRRA